MRLTFLLLAGLFALNGTVVAQPDRWQQRVNYQMQVEMNAQTNQYKGTQKLEYWNNSGDTLFKVFYHLYYNAFQPGSMMDVRSRRQGSINVGRGPDWDARVKDRIYNLKPEEIVKRFPKEKFI